MKFYPTDTDPQAHLWADPAFERAYLDAMCRDGRWGAGDEDAACDAQAWPDAEAPGTGGPVPGAAALFDAADAAGPLMRRLRALHAEADAMFAAVLRAAFDDPIPWAGPDPTIDPAWEHPAGWSTGRVRARRRDIAVRAAAADLGVRVGLTDLQVRARAHRADVLQTRCPRTWAACLTGDVSENNAATAATVAADLPADPAVWAAFDAAVCEPAQKLVPGKFRTRARVLRERVHPESVEQRHARAAKDRAVHITHEPDGMSSLFALIPSTRARLIEERLDGDARHLAAHPDEERTLAQLRADALCDLLGDLLAGSPRGGADSGSTADASTTCPVGRVTTVVHLTIPVLTLVGHSDEPATLDGVGPVSIDDARRLAGDADEWVRVLTHPVTGTVLDVERRAYRVPTSLRRWLGVTHPTCTFPGCSQPSSRCDIDHRKRWADGGTTTAENLAPQCPAHHCVKDESLWSLTRHPDTGQLQWRSPSGYVADVDPPPF